MEKVLKFLKQIKKNNNREWFAEHRELYQEARDQMEVLCDKVISGICTFDKKIAADTRAADCIFRIYRDVRFSKDKTPYKINMSASINPGGRKSVTAGYYLHIQPGENFIAGGVWMPEPPMLQAIRQEIDYNPEPLNKILQSKSFKKHFRGFDTEGSLRTVPKGYSADHPQIDLLKNRHFIVSHSFGDELLLGPSAVRYIVSGFKAMHPLMEYLRLAQYHEG